MQRKPYRRLPRLIGTTLLGLFLATQAVYAKHPDHETVHQCGVEEHDSFEMREQAGMRIHWHDYRAAAPESLVRFKLLGINDFHGQLEARSLFGRPVGGAAVLASYLNTENDEAHGRAIIVHAGDHVGASPPISALLQDEPAISFLNMLANRYCRYAEGYGRKDEEERHHGHDDDRDEYSDVRWHPRCNIVGTLGNHEFDEGVSEMLRLLRGGNHAAGPFLEDPYRGARFPYVIANVVDAATGEPILPPYVIKKIRGQKIAFIGAVLKETPTIVTPTGVAGVRFLDEAEAINHYVPELRRKGVRAIVVTIHQGTRQSFYAGPTQGELQPGPSSIVDIVRRLDDEIDVVVSGHAHGFTNTLLSNNNGKLILVTQAFSRSTAYADIDLAIDPSSGDIVEKSAAIITTWADEGPGFSPDTEVAALVEQANIMVAPLVNRVIGTAATDITRASNAAGESVLGNLIADAQRAKMDTDFSFMNPGGIRADLAAGEVTWGELFTVQPFNNDLVKMELSGDQIVRLLNQQWDGQAFPRIMKISGLTYTWDAARPVGDRIVSVARDDGTPLAMGAVYTVTVNSFMAAGGDNYTVLTEGTNRVTGPVDLDALIEFIENLPQPFSAAIERRIQRLN